MFVGYQAVGTLGRQIVDGAKQVRILGQNYKVKAKVTQIQSLSAHADKNEMLAWLEKFKKPPKKIFLVHGEPESEEAFKKFLSEKTGWQVAIPAYGDKITLE
jgi:metallo-beta-lactamase family protein